MSSVVIAGDTSGSITLDAPAVAGTTVLTLPATSGTLNTSGAVNVVPAGSAAAPAITTTGDTNTGIFFPAADTTAFAEGGVESMRIDASGNLLVGTTGIGGRGGFSIRPNLGGAGTYCRLVLNGNNADDLFYFQYQDTTVGRITISTNSTSYVTSSDYRLKENIAPMTGALDTIAQLKPVTYKWKVDGSDGQGFIAHELAEVVPDCVTGEKDAVNEDGSIKAQGIDTSFLVATLTAAIQELNAKVEAQAEQIKALQGAV